MLWPVKLSEAIAEAKVKKVSSPEELRQGYAEVPEIWVERREM